MSKNLRTTRHHAPPQSTRIKHHFKSNGPPGAGALVLGYEELAPGSDTASSCICRGPTRIRYSLPEHVPITVPCQGKCPNRAMLIGISSWIEIWLNFGVEEGGFVMERVMRCLSLNFLRGISYVIIIPAWFSRPSVWRANATMYWKIEYVRPTVGW